MNALWEDLRFGLRTLRKTPGFAFIAVVTLAVGIFSTTTIFSAVNGLLFRPLPVDNPEELAAVVMAPRGDPLSIGLLSYDAYVAIRDRSSAFSGRGIQGTPRGTYRRRPFGSSMARSMPRCCAARSSAEISSTCCRCGPYSAAPSRLMKTAHRAPTPSSS